MKNVNIMPTTWLLIAIIVVIVLHFALPIVQLVSFPWSLLGVVPLALGVVINLVADRAFHQNSTTVKPFQQSAVLITDGVFRVTRNPMYLGFVLILLGISLLMGSLVTFLATLAFGVFVDRAYIATEEYMLEERFPKEWASYKARTRRWV